MAHKKASGSSKNGRDSHSKRLGVKIYDNQIVKGGAILVRQRGSYFTPGNKFIGKGGDDTIFAKVSGKVSYKKLSKKHRVLVSLEPITTN